MCTVPNSLENSPWEARATRDTKAETTNIFLKDSGGSLFSWFDKYSQRRSGGMKAEKAGNLSRSDDSYRWI